ncbi:MAG TPA: MarR family winged helix-turn-helix transcriptional regulator [Gaiellales bacterium]|jgi:DNA-binding MarR family transcriptional regulator/GNAT superfamily N-acetyltransferase|nr:MarR family winged helix-turn-helix transcriptional regulator [Gaiellales bacterium]
MDADTVARVRSFNRTVTERVGALGESYLDRGRPLGETRLLWEIGPGGADVRDLRRRLGLDAGYASRLLRSLESAGLVVVVAGSEDRRIRRARLTADGLAEREELDRLSNGLAASMLEPLEQSQRARLVAAMDEVERLITASLVTITVADPANAEARWCIEQYFAELGDRFELGFDPAISLAAPIDELKLPTGLLLVAHLRRRPVGCGALKISPGRPVELKRMWVSPEVRGLGLGRRLLRELEHHAAEAGADTVRLETNRSLTEAIALYRTAGYREVAAFNSEAYAHHWFEKRL